MLLIWNFLCRFNRCQSVLSSMYIVVHSDLGMRAQPNRTEVPSYITELIFPNFLRNCSTTAELRITFPIARLLITDSTSAADEPAHNCSHNLAGIRHCSNRFDFFKRI